LYQLGWDIVFTTSYKENFTDEKKDWKTDWPGANHSGGGVRTGRLHFRRPLAGA
jgi:hypothetical protein